jgi:hypothetical protein
MMQAAMTAAATNLNTIAIVMEGVLPKTQKR